MQTLSTNSNRRMSCIVYWLVLVLTVIISRPGLAGDWPQILGPHRNGQADQEMLANSWPNGGPATFWQRPAGRGYAGMAVVGDKGILFHRIENEEVVECLDVRSGKPLWSKSCAPTTYVSGISPDDGPRCVPVIHGDRIIVFGAQGALASFRLSNGEKEWSRDTHKDFRASEGYFGAGSTPIVEGNKVIVNVGGAKSGAGVVAFALENGKTLWQMSHQDACYSSPVAATIAGKRHVFVETRLTMFSLDPENGSVRFEIPFGQRGPTVNGANPTVIGDHLFLTASYGIGALYAKVHNTSVDTLWTSNDILSSQYTTCIADRGVLYGIHGRDDVGTAILRCIDPANQKILWEKEGFGYATLIKADGKLLAQKTDGTLVLIRCDPKEYVELASAQIFNTKSFALPALASGRLFTRDERTLKCLDLGR